MSKLDGATFMATLPEFQSVEQQQAIQSYITNQSPTVKVPKVKAAKVTEADVDAANAIVDAEVAEMKAEMRLTFEEALAQVPMRDKGRFIKRDVREQMARELMA
jgi:hypothetical protein